MSEQVKVFKNVHTQTATGAAHSVTLASTTSTQKAVIKSVDCIGVGDATLDLDGRTVATGTTDIVASGNLIMDNSSTLSLKFPVISGIPGVTEFEAMIFSNGTDTGTYITSDTTTLLPATKLSTRTGSDRPTSGAFAYVKKTGSDIGETYFYRMWSDNVTAYTVASSTANNASYNQAFGSSCYCLCTDGTYMYSVGTGGNTTVYRRHLETNADSNFYTNTTFYGPQNNQGAWLIHHAGFLYTKQEGNTSRLDKIDVQYNADGTEGSTFGTVTTINSSNFNSGSYSSGGSIVTTTAGVTYLVDQGTTYYWYYNVATGVVVRSASTEGDDGSTEYGNGGFEISPGIFVCLGEQSDRFSRIDFNQSPPVRVEDTNTNPYLVSDSIGDSFAVAARMNIANPDRSYSAYTSGVLITEDV